jgi:hypothetical protein
MEAMVENSGRLRQDAEEEEKEMGEFARVWCVMLLPHRLFT